MGNFFTRLFSRNDTTQNNNNTGSSNTGNTGNNGGDTTVTTGPSSGSGGADNTENTGASSGSSGGSGSGGNDNNNNSGSGNSGSGSSSQVVTRYEIREMSPALQNRFFDAVDRMLINKNGAGTSEFFRLASYHGSPPPIYCKHGRETFPGWHRIYLMAFEKALQVADRENGNDGNIGLPYWDWTINPQEGLPSIVRERFNSWPADLFPPSVTNAPSQLTRASDGQIGATLVRADVPGDARDCLLSTQHFAHASTGGQWASQYPSLESPHNSVHGIVGGNGGPMGSVAWAAFDISFWLHHCFIDRIYETYLAMEPDSKDEFEENQDTQQTDLFEEAFEPFLKENGQPYYPHDTFDTRALGFVYDKPFPQPNGQQLRLAPTVALFPNVKVSQFESKCYQIHVYVVNKNEEEKFEEPARLGDINMDSDNYGGFAAIFGRGMECENCQTRLPYDIVIDITKTMGKLSLSRYEAILKTYLLETTESSDALIKVEDSPLSPPIITGPLFEDTETGLDQANKDTQNQEEVLALQRYLQRFGYYDEEMDGLFGPKTEKAVEIFQEATGSLKVDGLAGKLTKGVIRDTRRCSNKDPFGDNTVKDDLVDEKDEMYSGSKNIRFHIARVPGYLKRNACVAAIEKSFSLWSEALNNEIRFNIVQNKQEADITISWSSGSMRGEDNFMKFDGAGGVLGHGGYQEGKGFVVFDRSERWVIGTDTPYNKENELQPSDLNDQSTWYRGQPTISLFYTATHEIGHTLGLDHSKSAKDMMSPFYDPNKQTLSDNDGTRVRERWGIN